jgi:hypothetical protein
MAKLEPSLNLVTLISANSRDPRSRSSHVIATISPRQGPGLSTTLMMTTGSAPVPLPQTYHYIRFSINPPSSDALHVRRALQEALVQSFGAARSHTYLDVLWVADLGTECVVRTGGPTYVCPILVSTTNRQTRFTETLQASWPPPPCFKAIPASPL